MSGSRIRSHRNLFVFGVAKASLFQTFQEYPLNLYVLSEGGKKNNCNKTNVYKMTLSECLTVSSPTLYSVPHKKKNKIIIANAIELKLYQIGDDLLNNHFNCLLLTLSPTI